MLTLLIMLPIYSSINHSYPFYLPNMFFIVVFITLTRYIFLLKHTWFAYKEWVKVIFVFLPIPLLIYSTDALYDFQRFLDEDGTAAILGELNADGQYKMAKYIRYQKLFFGTGAILVEILFPFRMLVSLWRRRNRGTV